MRNNQPVTQREYELSEDALLISETDLRGVIRWGNPDFVEASGFDREELTGAPQNIVRHPDVPSAIFRDLWETIHAGRPWANIVKNRRKNGDHYWVHADVSPIRKDGHVVGYVSIRGKASREEIREAEQFYASAKRQRTGARRILDRLRRTAFRTRIRVEVGLPFLLGATAIACALLGWPRAAKGFGILFGMVGLWCWWNMERLAKACSTLFRAIEEGDLSHQVNAEEAGEVAHAAQAFNILTVRFRRILRELGRMSTRMDALAEELRVSSEEATAATQQIARSAKGQRETTERMSTAVTQFFASVEQVAQNSNLSSSKAEAAKAMVAEGNLAGQEAAQAMAAIRKSAEEMAKATQVIQEIARQTNLLSLNAAIEAAKAGHQGKGFAVVAEEVRKLAERSGSAAKEIQQLILSAGEAVERGGQKVSSLVERLGTIEDSIHAVTRMAQEIGLASQEQSRASEEIAQQVEVTSQEAHQVATASTQLAGSADELSRRSSALKEIVGSLRHTVEVFKV